MNRSMAMLVVVGSLTTVFTTIGVMHFFGGYLNGFFRCYQQYRHFKCYHHGSHHHYHHYRPYRHYYHYLTRVPSP